MKYFIANWKENKNIEEAASWIKEFTAKSKIDSDIKVILCPPHPLISEVKELVKDHPNIELGAQDVSRFEEGAYTGEVSAQILHGLVQYSIVGHSERRAIGETEEDIGTKIELLHKYDIKSILCIRGEKDLIYDRAFFVAYEPVEAIGTGDNRSLEHVLKMKSKLKLLANQKFIYGGSVNADNVKDYLKSTEIDGFLVGTASLDPQSFYKIVASI